jgi:hypothetical protein
MVSAMILPPDSAKAAKRQILRKWWPSFLRLRPFCFGQRFTDAARTINGTGIMKRGRITGSESRLC